MRIVKWYVRNTLYLRLINNFTPTLWLWLLTSLPLMLLQDARIVDGIISRLNFLLPLDIKLYVPTDLKNKQFSFTTS